MGLMSVRPVMTRWARRIVGGSSSRTAARPLRSASRPRTAMTTRTATANSRRGVCQGASRSAMAIPKRAASSASDPSAGAAPAVLEAALPREAQRAGKKGKGEVHRSLPSVRGRVGRLRIYAIHRLLSILTRLYMMAARDANLRPRRPPPPGPSRSHPPGHRAPAPRRERDLRLRPDRVHRPGPADRLPPPPGASGGGGGPLRASGHVDLLLPRTRSDRAAAADRGGTRPGGGPRGGVTRGPAPARRRGAGARPRAPGIPQRHIPRSGEALEAPTPRHARRIRTQISLWHAWPARGS